MTPRFLLDASFCTRAACERRGQRTSAYDLMIAGHARNREFVVVTGNLREFGRVDGPHAEDWLADIPRA